jgi:hypothetical protein
VRCAANLRGDHWLRRRQRTIFDHRKGNGKFLGVIRATGEVARAGLARASEELMKQYPSHVIGRTVREIIHTNQIQAFFQIGIDWSELLLILTILAFFSNTATKLLVGGRSFF